MRVLIYDTTYILHAVPLGYCDVEGEPDMLIDPQAQTTLDNSNQLFGRFKSTRIHLKQDNGEFIRVYVSERALKRTPDYF